MFIFPRILSGLILNLMFLLFMRSPAWASDIITIAKARSLPLGTVVTVVGSVTVPSGAFESSSFDKGFALQDPTAGIYVSIADDLGLGIKQTVRVTGQLTDIFGLLAIVPAAPTAVIAYNRGVNVKPLPLPTGSIGETTEGLLVGVAGTITQPVFSDLPYGYKVFIDDGSGEIQIFVNTNTGIDTSSLQPGQKIRVIGFSSQFDVEYEIAPRQPSDLVVLPN